MAARELERPGTGRVSAFDLTAAATTLSIGRRQVNTWAYGGQVPGQPLRVRQGDTMAVRLRNELPEATTIHWHGLAVRNDMDGVPDITQAVVGPGASFDYRFVVPDAGTYWFHPHMGLQLDCALYAPLIVEEKDDPGPYDLDQVVVLDDWLDGIDGNSPEKALKDLVSMGTGSMDMGDTTPMAKSSVLGGDAGDVTYPLHLMNGRPPEDPETFTVPAGGRARLRFINAGSDTAYRVAVGGHRMTVTHADGFPVAPVEVDTILIGMGERYDVTVDPLTGAWPLVALAEGKDATARAIIRTSDAVTSSAPPAAARPKELDGKRLRYSDLVATEEARLSTRRADLHQTLGLTGSMMGNSWGFDGKPFADHAPIEIEQGQRVRLTFENTTSMWHPIHLHGHSFRLGTNAAGARKDTVNVLPGESVTIDFDADNPGQWMTHCHNTYHLEQGMALLVSYVT
ncbi:multicopper oxidase family protein [Aquihabitans sp. G128]|uniref:multicopper oxidase family protein n=1 Tax=Aquihabitans sp. G128 TaxID=2849779 RepID=UPI001C21EC73|nr:multicopper oxidase family protein [Aquihabitans sp. G128]QXC60646.1 multicopper oxidase family protein [Aquihabitans sp. G128]